MTTKSNKTRSVIEKVYIDDMPQLSDIEYLLGLQSYDDLQLLFYYADIVRSEFCGGNILVRAIIEFSSYCQNTCMYCGLNRYNKNLRRYRLNGDQIMDAVRRAVKAGIKTVVLQSGQDERIDIDFIAGIITEIKQNYDIAVTLSLGEHSFETYRIWKEAGADRYLLKIETANKLLYESLHPGMSFENRLDCSKYLKTLGYQNGSGCIVGLKGQTIRTLAEDILFFKKENFDMIGIGIFIPHTETPLKNEPLGDLQLTLKTIAITRIITKNAHLPATTSLENIDCRDYRFTALNTGANVIMENFTPVQYRELYSIYPVKRCEEISQRLLENLNIKARKMHRQIGYSRGDSLKLKEKNMYSNNI